MTSLLFGFFVFTRANGYVHAVAPSVVINELMYHPVSGDEDEEYIELYNTTSASIDLNGWCFTSGVGLCFTNGMSIASHGYVVVSPNSAKFQALYGFTPTAIFTGHLDNSGEKVTLKDNTAATINSLTYSDHAPWPSSPDGTGPSLELKDPSLDNKLDSSWGASINAPTPNAVNSIYSAGLADVSAVTQVTNAATSSTPAVTAHATNAATVQLVYRLNFDNEQTIQMFDDGTHGDGAAGDFTYGTSLPAEAAGQLVRYKVKAINGNGNSFKPGSDETINYYGYTIADSTVTAPIPILQWFMPDSEYQDMYDNHVLDNQEFKSVLAYGNTVIDNVNVRIKGAYSRIWPKLGFNFDLPQGYTLSIPGYADQPVTGFDMTSTHIDATGAKTPIMWWAVQQSGAPTPQIFQIRTQRNGDFQGLYTFGQKYDKGWRQLYGYQSGTFYDGTINRTKPSEGTTEMDAWSSIVGDVRTPARRTYILDNDNIPNIINTMALETIIQGHDWSCGGNLEEYHDTASTGRWSILPNDLDITFENQQLITPYDSPDYIPGWARACAASVYDEPDFRAMYFRRLRTLVDMLYTGDQFKQHFAQAAALIRTVEELDFQKWGTLNTGSTIDSQTDGLLNQFDTVKKEFLVRFQRPWAIPAAQTSNNVAIDNVDQDLNTSNQYIRLKNNSSEYIDISGWTITGINYTIPPGAVVAPHGTVLFLKNDAGYKAAHGGGVFVGGQYTGNLSDTYITGLNLKDRTGQTVSSWSY